jgi:post-segregation antitoxin (ccd killing protein)
MVAEYAKVSVTLPAGLLERIRGRVGARGLSSYVAEALEDEERRSALRAWLTEQEDEYGPIPASLLEEVRGDWSAPGAETAGTAGRCSARLGRVERRRGRLRTGPG